MATLNQIALCKFIVIVTHVIFISLNNEKKYFIPDIPKPILVYGG
jgi:hypothetical protein